MAPHGERTRPSILINSSILVDTGPDIYRQLNRLPYEALGLIDHIIISHPHADHYMGLDDLAGLRRISRLPVLPIYAPSDGWDRIWSAFRYLIASEASEYDRRPFARRAMRIGEPLAFDDGLVITPLDTHHTQVFTTAGLLIEQYGRSLFYASDFHYIDSGALADVEVLVLDGSFLTQKEADRRYTPHPEEGQGRHLPMLRGLQWGHQVGARRIVFTHLGHVGLTDQELISRLADPVCTLAHDGMAISLPANCEEICLA